jgi:3-phenylpropionate/trans-cinnamate dioxygenase ferredoxin reductase subunit
MPSQHVIVGGGLAGAKAAETLRSEGFDGEITIVATELLRPYERPELSKGFLRGDTEREAVFVHPAGFYEEHAITLLTGCTAEAIDPATATVTLDDGRRLDYDALLIATGSEPRRPNLAGVDLDGVHLLRTLPDSEALRTALRDAAAATTPVAVVGGGWIGCEVAAVARQLGCDVTLLTGAAGPLEHVLGPELAAMYAEVHTGHGVRIVRESLAAIEGDGGRAAGVRTDGGTAVACGLVVLGVGVTPRTALASAAGLAVGPQGILVDGRLATDHPNIYAAGDVVLHDHPVYGPLHTEHWHNALEQGPAVARSMLGGTDPYTKIPYFFSDQYDVGMEYAGHPRGGERLVIRGDLAARELIAFWVDDRAGGSAGAVTVRAGMNVNVWDVTDDIQALIAAGTAVDEARLADPGVPLPELLED